MDVDISPEDYRALVRDKYDGKEAPELESDLARLRSGEPLAYVIGWTPFLGVRVPLSTRPLIPRVETEWWTEQLVTGLRERGRCRVLDLCAGSGAIGLAVLRHAPAAHVTFSELMPEHVDSIAAAIVQNGLDGSRAHIVSGDVFSPVAGERFNVIATNPPYVPEGRPLPESVSMFEPSEALYAGEDGLGVIRRIAHEVPKYLNPGGELWLECDTAHADEAAQLLLEGGAREAVVTKDQYGRPRCVVSYYP